MKILGLTGAIGSGKSTVARMFLELGAEIFNADEVAHLLLQKDAQVIDAVHSMFGTTDRAALAKKVFSDPAARKKLEQILHPRVREQAEISILAARQSGALLMVLDIPLLFEAGMHKRCDHTVAVWVDEAKAFNRLQKERGMQEAEIRRRMQAQLSAEEKKALADTVIDNNGSIEDTRLQVQKLYERLIKDA